MAAAVGVGVVSGCHRDSDRWLEPELFNTWAFGFSGKFAAMRNPLAQRLIQLVDQISTIIVGKRPQIEDCVACMLAGGHLLIEDVPGVGKTTLAHALAVSLGLALHARAVHRRPDAVGPERRERLRAQQGSLRVPPGPGVRAGVARRRDQPRGAEDAKRAARSDGGAAGHRRRRDARAAEAVLRDRDAEPDRPSRHLSAARIAARPLPDVPDARLPGPRVRARAARRAGPARGDRRAAHRDDARRADRRAKGGARGARVRTRCSTTCRR